MLFVDETRKSCKVKPRNRVSSIEQNPESDRQLYRLASRSRRRKLLELGDL